MLNTNKTGKSGYYFNINTWELILADNKPLKKENGRFLYVPVLLLLAIVPFLGAVFVIFLPVIGIVIFTKFVVVEAWKLLSCAATTLIATVTVEWQPGRAFLVGKCRRHKKNPPTDKTK